MNEDTYAPPFYTDLYNFRDGAQNDIFENSYDSIPVPSPNQTVIPNLRVSPGNSGMPALPSSSSGVPSSPTPSNGYPTPSPSNSIPPPPAVTVTDTVYITATPNTVPTFSGYPNPSSSTGSPVPSPSESPCDKTGDPGVVSLDKRKPM